MKVYVFAEDNSVRGNLCQPDRIRNVLEKVAATTETAGLAVAGYLLGDSNRWGGHMIPGCLDRTQFYSHSGRGWAFIRSWPPPADLPERFNLIRMVFGTAARYPRTTQDNHGWKQRFPSFDHHLASLFAHELHHHRRHHLGLHHGEGEQSACKWGLQRAKEAGFHVDGSRRRKSRKARKSNVSLALRANPRLVWRAKLVLSRLSLDDLNEIARWVGQRLMAAEGRAKQKQIAEHYEKLRALPDGALVRITEDDEYLSQYVGQTGTKIRALRRNSHRLAIRTPDGKVWRWPMDWLEVVE